MSDIASLEYAPDIWGMSFDELSALPGITIEGASVVKKRMILGVPFVVTKAVYHPIPTARPDALGYVSLFARIAGAEAIEAEIRRQRIWVCDASTGEHVSTIGDIRELAVEPEEAVVINDGSTGVRRQVTKILSTLGLLDIGVPFTGDDSIYDTPWPKWESFAESSREGDMVIPSFSRLAGDRPLIIKCFRGLRVSGYDTDASETGKAATFYLA